MFPISAPFAFFVDRNGDPLQDGYVYFGEPNQNPETEPITVYWNREGTIPATQPIRTINGYPARNGAPSQIYIAEDHSITVRDRQRRIVITDPRATDAYGTGAVQTVNIADGAVTGPKLDPNGVELPDGSTATTQAGGDNSDLVATTAQVQAAVTLALNTFLQEKVYPVGSPYISFTTTDNPNTILGFGTWVQIAGRTIVGYDNSQTEFDALLETGGAKTHTLTIGEIPSHNHSVPANLIAASGSGGFIFGAGNTVVTGSTGGGGSHNNLQPYVVAAIWRRTA